MQLVPFKDVRETDTESVQFRPSLWTTTQWLN